MSTGETGTGVTFEEMTAPGREGGVPPGEKTAADLEAVFDVPVTHLRGARPRQGAGRQLLKLDVGTWSNSTARSARPSTSTSTTAWSRAAKSSSSRTGSASP